MTKEEALNIPELQINPNDLVEDCFYYKLAKAGRLSEDSGKKALERVQGKEDDPCYKGAMVCRVLHGQSSPFTSMLFAEDGSTKHNC